MTLTFRNLREYQRGILNDLLRDAYSFDPAFENYFGNDWKEFDDFFFDNLEIADNFLFITTLEDSREPIGLVSWDPRQMPDCVIIGHNCIASRYKKQGFGKLQLQEAINRIADTGVKRLLVTTNEDLVPAQRQYESVGFLLRNRRKNLESIGHDYLDYELIMEDGSMESIQGTHIIKATILELPEIYKLVQNTIKEIYPRYYPKEIVDFFCHHHSEGNIEKDIVERRVWLVYDHGTLVATGTLEKNHITRVYVLPEKQNLGYGSWMIEQLENELAKEYSQIDLEASLPACIFYERLGYTTMMHEKYQVEHGVILVYEIMGKTLLPRTGE